MSAPLAGQIVKASAYPVIQVVTKAATESVTSSTTLQNDDDITVALAAGKTYKIVLHLAFTGPTAADLKAAWATTGGVAQLTLRACVGPEASTTSTAATLVRRTYAASLTTAVQYGTDGGGTWGYATEEFLVETTSSGLSGTLTLQWAQQVSNGTPTNVTAGTWMEVVEVDLI